MMPAISEQLKPTLAAARKSLISEVVRTILIAVVAFVLLRLVILPYRVEGPSMNPTLETSELLLVGRQAYFHFDLNAVLNIVPFVHEQGQHLIYPLGTPQRGDIVILHPPVPSSEPYVKRIIGLPGEHLSFRSGAVYVNGVKLDEPYLHGVATIWTGQGSGQDIVVPQGDVFVMGDNRGNSSDSRLFGPVKINELVGKAWVSLWPLNRARIFTAPSYSH